MDNEAKQGGDLYALVAWADKNRKQLLWTVGAVVIAGAAAGLYFMHKDSRETSANAAFCALKLPIPGRDTPTAALAAQFEQLADEYPETSGGIARPNAVRTERCNERPALPTPATGWRT